jgi:hypothetical protein
MKKRWYVIVPLIVLFPLMWFLFSSLFITVELDEPSPLDDVEMIEDQEVADTTVDETEMDNIVEVVQDDVVEKDDAMPNQPSILYKADFEPDAHDVEGHALVIKTDDATVLRFEDFETINGPELHIYLSTSLGNDDFVDLGVIKATEGNVNYDVPEDVDLEQYNNVLVWCKPFGVLFSYATFE